MKHEYHFTISRTDRISLIAFVIFLLGWELVKHLIPSVPSGYVLPSDIEHSTPYDLQDSTKTIDLNNITKTNERNEAKEAYAREQEDIAEIEPVAIMESSWEDLRRIGFSSKTASNIQKYIAAGGVLKNEKDVLKIYGMDSVQWAIVSPYIIFPEQVMEPDYTTPSNEVSAIDRPPLDLNTASAYDLESLPGIGTILADRIIKYRTSLGGFLNLDQLRECYGLPPETLEKILPRLTISQPPTPIAINEIDLADFNHPYLNKKMVRLLQAYKKQHGPFKDASDLRKIYPPDSTWCEKIMPYIVFK